MKKILIGILVSLSIILAFTGCEKVFESKETQNLPENVINDTVDDVVADTVEYVFRNQKLLNQHYDKHGKDMGFASADDYEKAASDVVNNPAALHKTEKEDGDDVYYVEATNEFVVVSTDGYIRTYFNPDSGKRYFDKQ